MSRMWRGIVIAVLVGGWLAAVALAAADRKPEEILKDLDAAPMPQFDPAKANDREAITKFIRQRQERAELILELYEADPDNDRLVELLPERWETVPVLGPQAGAVARELDDVIAHTRSAKLKAEAAFAKVRMAYIQSQSRRDATALLPAVEAFLKLAPEDPRGPGLLMIAAGGAADEAKRAEIEDRILKDFPDSPFAEQIRTARRQREALGKPFDLEFKDAISGKTVAMKDLKGKVVVVDFWATWCPPCVAEMPKMKRLYAEYKDKGVEFLGISLDQPEDQGGLKALKQFVERNEITWPQYYQGNFWQSEFSRSWGINALPCIFVVDQDGKLYSVEARDKLQEMIPELLKKGKPAAAGG